MSIQDAELQANLRVQAWPPVQAFSKKRCETIHHETKPNLICPRAWVVCFATRAVHHSAHCKRV
jgi:hypothetical protein